jgi:hypothetical protein
MNAMFDAQGFVNQLHPQLARRVRKNRPNDLQFYFWFRDKGLVPVPVELCGPAVHSLDEQTTKDIIRDGILEYINAFHPDGIFVHYEAWTAPRGPLRPSEDPHRGEAMFYSWETPERTLVWLSKIVQLNKKRKLLPPDGPIEKGVGGDGRFEELFMRANALKFNPVFNVE